MVIELESHDVAHMFFLGVKSQFTIPAHGQPAVLKAEEAQRTRMLRMDGRNPPKRKIHCSVFPPSCSQTSDPALTQSLVSQFSAMLIKIKKLDGNKGTLRPRSRLDVG